MRSSRCAVLLLLAAASASASDISVRYGNGLSRSQSHGVFDFTPSYDGKVLLLAYTHRPWADRTSWVRNLYIEGGAGVHSAVDFGEITSSVFELAPGARVNLGSVRVWLSHGGAYFTKFVNKPKFQFATRLGVAFVDSVTGVAIGLERSHYSTGSVDPRAFSGDDYVGLTLSVPLGGTS